MEHAQRGSPDFKSIDEIWAGLNPYFNGTCSKRLAELAKVGTTCKSLNPYFNGTCSKRLTVWIVLVCVNIVLILILMEHAQRDKDIIGLGLQSLNPYFNGTCSKRPTRLHGY